METVNTFRFLGTHITAGHSWTHNIRVLVKAQQRLHFLRALRKNNLDTKLLLAFYHSSVESVLTYCLSVWYAGSTAKDRKAVHRVINTAQKIIGCPLPSLENISTSCCLRKIKAITGDPSHPAYPLFDLLPSGRRYRSTKSHTSRLTKSFPWAIQTANAYRHTHCPPPWTITTQPTYLLLPPFQHLGQHWPLCHVCALKCLKCLQPFFLGNLFIFWYSYLLYVLHYFLSYSIYYCTVFNFLFCFLFCCAL